MGLNKGKERVNAGCGERRLLKKEVEDDHSAPESQIRNVRQD